MMLETLTFQPYRNGTTVTPFQRAVLTATLRKRDKYAHDRSERTWAVRAEWGTNRARNGRDAYTVWVTIGCTTMTLKQFVGKTGKEFVRRHGHVREQRALDRLRVAFGVLCAETLGGYITETHIVR